MAINILGISAFFHDSAAALIRDGEIIAAAQEERFTRRKHDPGYPSQAIDFCLKEGGVNMTQLDYVVFYEKPMVKFERLLESYIAFAPQGYDSFRKAAPLWATEKLHLPEKILGQLGPNFHGRLCFTDHHESHAASAYFPSPFNEAAILTLDAAGEWSTSSIGCGKENRIDLTHEMRFPHSLGMLYSAFTYYAGFKVNSGEYKLMGLAPYGRSKYVDTILDNIAQIRPDGSLSLDMSYFNYCQGLTMTSEKFHDLFGGPPRQGESWLTQKEMDLAASIQVICEEVVLRAARHAHGLTGMRNLVMAGGVALNCVANGRLLREGPFHKIWVQPAAGDAGGALGAAYLIWHHLLDKPRRPNPQDSQQGSLLGPTFKNEEIGLFLNSVAATYEFIQDEPSLLDRVTHLIEEGKIVGWFQGRMEYGPRALGCRSILGDARSTSLQQTMNLKIKFRESFRPFAPCILRECVGEVVEMEEDIDTPYMLFVANIRNDLRAQLSPEEIRQMQDPDLRVRVAVPRSSLPAVTHVDYSARVQTVDGDRHGRFYRLLRRFYEETGCPVVVNTSFNIRGEPIVCTPEDAYFCFMATEIDCLVIENYVLMKSLQPSSELAHDRRVQSAVHSRLMQTIFLTIPTATCLFDQFRSNSGVHALADDGCYLRGRLESRLASSRVGILQHWRWLLRRGCRPEWWMLPYRVWSKLARVFASVARPYLLLVCFYTIFPVLRFLGSSFISFPGISPESAWVERGTLPVTMYGSQHHAVQERAGVCGWVRSYGSWAMRSGQPWVLALLPFLILLSMVRTGSRKPHFLRISTLSFDLKCHYCLCLLGRLALAGLRRLGSVAACRCRLWRLEWHSGWYHGWWV